MTENNSVFCSNRSEAQGASYANFAVRLLLPAYFHLMSLQGLFFDSKRVFQTHPSLFFFLTIIYYSPVLHINILSCAFHFASYWLIFLAEPMTLQMRLTSRLNSSSKPLKTAEKRFKFVPVHLIPSFHIPFAHLLTPPPQAIRQYLNRNFLRFTPPPFPFFHFLHTSYSQVTLEDIDDETCALWDDASQTVRGEG